MLTRCLIQLVLLVASILAAFAAVEPSAEVDDFYVFARPFNRFPAFAESNELGLEDDSRQKRYGSSLRFGKRAAFEQVGQPTSALAERSGR
ncbi:hypothetical protein M3Y99_00051400 [Aphelenchoides fujianensis]|nr:hypothetical protein M3Y99_00051400 [Aphelenchoides fujianensis]